MSEPIPFKPYARLLTMIGDQLIKNECVAIMELIKNAYDADASWCRVSFDGFGSDGSVTPKSRIVIEDDGCGMTADIIRNAWMAPASPNKKKTGTFRLTSKKHRIMQGEKGIGRFALLKLGAKITVVTRPDDSASENVLVLDFSDYKDEFTLKGDKPTETLLSDLKGHLSERTASDIVPGPIPGVFPVLNRGETGTKIIVEVLRHKIWSKPLLEQIVLDASYLQPLISDIAGGNRES